MRSKKRSLCSRICRMVFIMILILAAVLPTGRPVCASETEPVSAEAVIARPSSNGRLHVEAEQLADENGTPVQLRGPSTHGLTWFPDFINEELFQQISEDWNCNVIRLAMYSSMREHLLPTIPQESYPEVDIFIATYNEPVDLLRRTVNGCKHLKYPDLAKVHI